MLFRIVFSLIYLITLEIGITASLKHNDDSNICKQDKEPQNNFKCDFHCMSQGLVDNDWLISEKNNFGHKALFKIQLTESYINFDLEIFPRTNSPPSFS